MKLRGFYKYIIGILLLGIGTSCDDEFLSQVPDDRLTLDQTFENQNTVEQYLASIYTVVPDEMSQRELGENSGPWTGGSDEAEYVWAGVLSNEMNIGSWNASTGWINAKWINYYRGIRSATYFMQHVDDCNECPSTLVTQYKAEVRMLRALFYYHLMRLYGPVVIMGDDAVSPDADESAFIFPRSSMEDCVNYVAAELNEAMKNLPEEPRNVDSYGRMTKPFAMAIRSQVYLLAASPLFNGNTYYADLVDEDGTPLISQTYDVEKWGRAADSYKEFLDTYVPGLFSLYRVNNSEGEFDPYLSCRDVMLDDWNNEIIMARPQARHDLRQYEMTPFHSGAASEARGGGGLGATQEIVDAYFTANGRSIDDPESGYVESGYTNFQAPYDFEKRQVFSQWANREPRFYVGITYDNSLWLNTNTGNIITRTWYEGNSGRKVGGNDYSPTGYVVRKNMSLGAWYTGGRAISMLRLAEIYLDYAEALNEYDPGNPEILTYINLVRNRAGIPEYGSAELSAPDNQAEMREAIRKERRVELAFENVRYFDARRWLIAEAAFGGPMHGLDINSTDIEEFHDVVVFENRVFNERHYLWPLPQDDININKQLVQNTGW